MLDREEFKKRFLEVPSEAAKLLFPTLLLSQIFIGRLLFLLDYRGPRFLQGHLIVGVTAGWFLAFPFCGLGLLYRKDGTIPRRTRSRAAALSSLILPALIGTEYLVSTQIQYFQPPMPDLAIVVWLSFAPFLWFGIIWLCDVIRKA